MFEIVWGWLTGLSYAGYFTIGAVVGLTGAFLAALDGEKESFEVGGLAIAGGVLWPLVVFFGCVVVVVGGLGLLTELLGKGIQKLATWTSRRVAKDGAK